MSTDAQHSIPAVHALHLVELVRRWDVSPEELLAPLGLRAEALADPGARLPVRVIEALVEQARRLTGEPGLGFFLGLQMRVSSHGYLGFAAMTSATVRDALEIAVRFAPTRTGAIALRLAVDGARAALVMEESADFGTARDVVVLSLLVGVWQIGRALTGRELAGSADVRWPEPPYFARFRHVLPGVVRFGQPVHQLVFDAAVLELPLNMADPAAERLAREQCERELEALGAGAGIAAAVRRALADPGGAGGAGGAGGFRGLEQVARALAMSPRTLKRKLAEAGASFSGLLDEQRRDRALLLLRDGALTLDAIAERLGYSDVANFTRAFRRWTGTTPGAPHHTGAAPLVRHGSTYCRHTPVAGRRPRPGPADPCQRWICSPAGSKGTCVDTEHGTMRPATLTCQAPVRTSSSATGKPSRRHTEASPTAAPTAAPYAAEVTWPHPAPSRKTSSPPHSVTSGSASTSETTRRSGPVARAFSSASRPRKGVSERSLVAKRSPASTGLTSGPSSAPKAR